MESLLVIGENRFNTKKDALLYYKNILNSYEFDQKLNQKDQKDVLDLLELHPEKEKKTGAGIDFIKVSEYRYNTRAFVLVRVDGTAEVFSYTRRIQSPRSDFSKFSKACRFVIQNDLREVKLLYFKQNSSKGKAKCQESSEILPWESLSVDHRQPNTFSVIVDRFIELYKIDVSSVKYEELKDGGQTFADLNLIQNFRDYHKEKANLRIINKKLNLAKSYQAKIKKQKKDLSISKLNHQNDKNTQLKST